MLETLTKWLDSLGSSRMIKKYESPVQTQGSGDYVIKGMFPPVVEEIVS